MSVTDNRPEVGPFPCSFVAGRAVLPEAANPQISAAGKYTFREYTAFSESE
ncbi:MAG TPA: hypothetical protein VHZ81_06005 [Galbitalea sp.]|jgi:hypothetical protein|nr:hypothetical protein [Galbitalea sp.]